MLVSRSKKGTGIKKRQKVVEKKGQVREREESHVETQKGKRRTLPPGPNQEKGGYTTGRIEEKKVARVI